MRNSYVSRSIFAASLTMAAASCSLPESGQEPASDVEVDIEAVVGDFEEDRRLNVLGLGAVETVITPEQCANIPNEAIPVDAPIVEIDERMDVADMINEDLFNWARGAAVLLGCADYREWFAIAESRGDSVSGVTVNFDIACDVGNDSSGTTCEPYLLQTRW